MFAPQAPGGIIGAGLLILRSLRVPAVLLALALPAVGSDCGGEPFTGGSGSDASTDGSDGAGQGDVSSSSSGGATDAPSCPPPDTNNPRCDQCLANHCDAEWCGCLQETGCAVYIGCLLRGNPVATCVGACGCAPVARMAGDKLLTCAGTHCLTECAGDAGSSSGSSSGASGSSSGVLMDGGPLCTCPPCDGGLVCCTMLGSPECGHCYNLACGSCCL
jgi:hypothetical protein